MSRFLFRIACTYISGVFSWGSVSCPFLDSPLTPFNRSEWNSHRWIDGESSSCLCRDSVSLFSIGLIERYHNKTKQNINIIDLANVFIRFLFLDSFWVNINNHRSLSSLSSDFIFPFRIRLLYLTFSYSYTISSLSSRWCRTHHSLIGVGENHHSFIRK